MNILSFFFPKRCVGCGKIGKYFCDQCVFSVEKIQTSETICPVCGKPAIRGFTHPRCKTKYSLDGLISFFHYRGVIKQAIKSIKYWYVSDIANELISLCVSNSETIQRWNNFILIPIPLHPARLKFRGFNQAEKLGENICSLLDLRIESHLLTRVRKTTPQVEMKNRTERLNNMKHVFSVNDTAIRQLNKHTAVILFDDVWTTGATLRSACETLKRSGFQHVWGMTIAR